MPQEREEHYPRKQDREGKPGRITPWLVAVLVVAAFIPWGRLFSGYPAVYEMRVGSTVTRVPRPKNALPAPKDGAAELGFIIGDANKAENVGYFSRTPTPIPTPPRNSPNCWPRPENSIPASKDPLVQEVVLARRKQGGGYR